METDLIVPLIIDPVLDRNNPKEGSIVKLNRFTCTEQMAIMEYGIKFQRKMGFGEPAQRSRGTSRLVDSFWAWG